MDDTQPTLTTLEWAQQKMMSRHDDGYGSPAIVIAFAQAAALTRIADALEKVTAEDDIPQELFEEQQIMKRQLERIADNQHSAFNYVVSEMLEMTEVLKRIADVLERFVNTNGVSAEIYEAANRALEYERQHKETWGVVDGLKQRID